MNTPEFIGQPVSSQDDWTMSEEAVAACRLRATAEGVVCEACE
jgi:hypothetical protein